MVHSAGLDELTPMAPADIVEVDAHGYLREFGLEGGAWECYNRPAA